MDDINFTCGHCGVPVPWIEVNGERRPRNHCPYCLWSRHVSAGAEYGYPPCGAMMRGIDAGGDEVISRCTRCGFTCRYHTDDYTIRALAAAGLVRNVTGVVYAGGQLPTSANARTTRPPGPGNSAE